MDLFNILGCYDSNGNWLSSAECEALTTTSAKCSADLIVIVRFIKGILGLIQIVVPIILIIVGAFDLAKAVMGSDEKEIKAATQKLIKRAIAAVCVFFLSTAVQVVMHYVADSRGEKDDQQEWLLCWKSS